MYKSTRFSTNGCMYNTLWEVKKNLEIKPIVFLRVIIKIVRHDWEKET